MKKNVSFQIPSSLRTWFIIHFAIDILFAIPLFFFPTQFLAFFNIAITQPLLARLIAAALIAIGTNSLLMHKKNQESFATMLNLKLIWSATASLALLLFLLTEFNYFILLTLLIFVGFFFIWLYFRKRMK